MSIIYYILAFLCGVTNSTQSGVNAELRRSINNPIYAAIISFASGLVGLILITPFFKESVPTIATLKSLEWWKLTHIIVNVYFFFLNIESGFFKILVKSIPTISYIDSSSSFSKSAELVVSLLCLFNALSLL